MPVNKKAQPVKRDAVIRALQGLKGWQTTVAVAEKAEVSVPSAGALLLWLEVRGMAESAFEDQGGKQGRRRLWKASRKGRKATLLWDRLKVAIEAEWDECHEAQEKVEPGGERDYEIDDYEAMMKAYSTVLEIMVQLEGEY